VLEFAASRLLDGQEVLQAVREMVDAAELGDDDRLDAAAKVGADLGVGDWSGPMLWQSSSMRTSGRSPAARSP
jgi:hypothetical protein